MTPSSAACSRCGRPLAPGEERRVPAPLAAAAEIACAFFHGGLWAREALECPFCARCVRLVSAVAASAGGVVLTAVAFGLAVWLHGPGR